VWYPRLKKFTFKTKFIPLTRDEAYAIMHHYQTFLGRPQLTENDVDVLLNLERRIDAEIFLNFHNGAFFEILWKKS
jgi:hypothetical protein